MNKRGQQTARLDAVEIKITVGAEDLERAIEVFGLDPAEGKQRVIYFVSWSTAAWATGATRARPRCRCWITA